MKYGKLASYATGLESSPISVDSRVSKSEARSTGRSMPLSQWRAPFPPAVMADNRQKSAPCWVSRVTRKVLRKGRCVRRGIVDLSLPLNQFTRIGKPQSTFRHLWRHPMSSSEIVLFGLLISVRFERTSTRTRNNVVNLDNDLHLLTVLHEVTVSHFMWSM